MRCVTCLMGYEHEFEHGYSGYHHHGCRCDKCKNSNSERARIYRKNRQRRMKPDERERERRHRRDLRKINHDRVLEYERSYRERNREHIRELNRKYFRIRDPQYERERWQNYRNRNLEQIREKNRNYWHQNHTRSLSQSRAYRARNRTYTNFMVQQRRQKLKEIPAPRNGEPYTRAEDRIIVRNDITCIEIAYILGRTYRAVQSRRKLLNNPERITDTTCLN